jgi:signal transduction histidine kinase
VRTTAAATLIVGLALTFGAVGLVTLLHRSQIDGIETAAGLRARDVGALVRSGTLPPTLPGGGGDTALVQVVDGSGRVIAATDNVSGEAPITDVVPRAGASVARTVRAPIGEGGAFRVVALRVTPPQGASVVVYAATSLEAAQETQHTLATALAVGTPVLVALVAGTTWLLTGTALRPVERIRAEVGEITARRLGRRVPEPGGSDEIARLARTMNEMLDRIEVASDRQRRFVADASHELRSPLSSLRAQLEVARAYPARADWLAMTDDSLAELDRMDDLTRDLLTLARLDADREHVAERVNVAELVRDEAATLAARGVVAVDASGLPENAVVLGDRNQLAGLFRNVLDNAERYAASAITIAGTVDPSGVEFTVADDGPGIPPADRDRVFERFTRLDDARDRDSGGTGLGLAISREIARAHGGTISVIDASRGARIAVRLPRGTDA